MFETKGELDFEEVKELAEANIGEYTEIDRSESGNHIGFDLGETEVYVTASGEGYLFHQAKGLDRSVEPTDGHGDFTRRVLEGRFGDLQLGSASYGLPMYRQGADDEEELAELFHQAYQAEKALEQRSTN